MQAQPPCHASKLSAAFDQHAPHLHYCKQAAQTQCKLILLYLNQSASRHPSSERPQQHNANQQASAGFPLCGFHTNCDAKQPEPHRCALLTTPVPRCTCIAITVTSILSPAQKHTHTYCQALCHCWYGRAHTKCTVNWPIRDKNRVLYTHTMMYSSAATVRQRHNYECCERIQLQLQLQHAPRPKHTHNHESRTSSNSRHIMSCVLSYLLRRTRPQQDRRTSGLDGNKTQITRGAASSCSDAAPC